MCESAQKLLAQTSPEFKADAEEYMQLREMNEVTQNTFVAALYKWASRHGVPDRRYALPWFEHVRLKTFEGTHLSWSRYTELMKLSIYPMSDLPRLAEPYTHITGREVRVVREEDKLVRVEDFSRQREENDKALRMKLEQQVARNESARYTSEECKQMADALAKQQDAIPRSAGMAAMQASIEETLRALYTPRAPRDESVAAAEKALTGPLPKDPELAELIRQALETAGTLPPPSLVHEALLTMTARLEEEAHPEKPSCVKCSRELAPLLDAYYGTTRGYASMCASCRPRD